MSRRRTPHKPRCPKTRVSQAARTYSRVSQTVALTMALATSSALAQDTDQRETFTLSPVDVQDQRPGALPTHLGLSRLPQPVRDIPQSITLLPKETLQEQGITSFRDALRNVTGISLNAGEGGGAQGDNLTLRGFSARNDYFLDGIRDQGSYTRDVFNIETIEVLKGPSAVLFGRGATGGAINQVSKAPQLEPLYSGTLSLGTGLLLRGTADLNHPLTKSSAFRLNVMAHDEHVVSRNEIELKRFGLAPAITFGLGTPTQVTASYLLQSEDNVPDYGLPFLFGKPAPVSRENFYGLTEEDYERTLLNVATLRLEHRFSAQLSLRNTLRYSRTDREALVTTGLAIVGTPTPRTPLASISVTRTRPGRDTEETILANATDLTWRFNTLGVQHTLSTGLDIARETFNALRTTFANVPTANLLHPEVRPDTSRATRSITARTETTATAFGLYAVDQIRLLPQLDLLGGLRWDRFSADFTDTVPVPKLQFDRTDDKVSYRAGLVFHPVPTQSYYFSFGTSFNPSAEALALATTTADTAPESNRSFEVGAKLALFNETLSVQAALFRLEKTSARATDPVTQLQVLTGAQRVQGFEVGLNGQILPGWNLSLGYAYLDPTILRSTTLQNNVRIEGKQLQNTPRHSANLWTTYDLSAQWQAGTGVTYVGERFANNSNTNLVPETVRWDATVAYQLNKEVQLRLNVINITDALYYDGVHPGHVVPGAGRTVLLSGSVRY